MPSAGQPVLLEGGLAGVPQKHHRGRALKYQDFRAEETYKSRTVSVHRPIAGWGREMDPLDEFAIDPVQQLAAAVVRQAVEDAVLNNAALQWLASPVALGWLALLTPAGLTPQDLQETALQAVRRRRATLNRRFARAG